MERRPLERGCWSFVLSLGDVPGGFKGMMGGSEQVPQFSPRLGSLQGRGRCWRGAGGRGDISQTPLKQRADSGYGCPIPQAVSFIPSTVPENHPKGSPCPVGPPSLLPGQGVPGAEGGLAGAGDSGQTHSQARGCHRPHTPLGLVQQQDDYLHSSV